MKYITIYTFLFILVKINIANAQIKLGTIDTNQIVEKSIAYVEATKVLEKKMKRLQNSAIQASKILSNKFIEFEKKKNFLSLSEYNKIKNDLIKEEEILQKKFYSQRIILDKQFNKINQIIEEHLKNIVDEIAKEKNITMIFNKILTLYNEQSIDITHEVIEKLNKELRFIDLNSLQDNYVDKK